MVEGAEAVAGRFEVGVETDVEFGRGGSRALVCDVFRPVEVGLDAPAAILVHGGGWRRGSRAGMHRHARRLAERGIVAVTPEYRLTDEAPWPAHLEDVKACLRWVRAQASRLGVHPERIALVGFSAGAHLALMAAGTPGDPRFSGSGGSGEASEVVNAVAAFFPPIRIQPGAERDNGALPASAGDSLGPDIDAAAAREASPIEYVGPRFPPTLALHGTADEVVSPRTSQQLFEALQAASVEVDLRLYAGQRHEFVHIEAMSELAMADVALFLRRVLVEPERFAFTQAEVFAL